MNPPSPSKAAEPDPSPTVFYVGQHERNRVQKVTPQVLQQAQECSYDMLTTPITTPEFHTSILTLISNYLAQIEDGALSDEVPLPLVPPLKPSDSPISPNETLSHLLAVSSSWIDLASPDPLISNISRQVLNLEIAYAAFCGVGNVIIQGPRLNHGALHGQGVSQFARAIQEALSIGPYLQLQILCPMVESSEADIADGMGHLAPFARSEYVPPQGESEQKVDFFGTWDAWNVVRSVCNYSPRLLVALTLPKHLPPMAIQSRWFSEPLRLLLIPASSFLKNAKGYPVLSKPHQNLITRYMQLRTAPWILLVDVGPIPGLADANTLEYLRNGALSPGANSDALRSSVSPAPTPAEAAKDQPQGNPKKFKDPTPHLSYIRHLQRTQPARTPVERFSAGYQDYLQAPLQPLTDNLESITYEVFEKDPIKYDWYERAIAQALQDWIIEGKETSSTSGAVVVAVAGAGRGPLVTRALRASEVADVDIELWAVEKNPNAYVLLQQHNEEEWDFQVRVIKSDMRSWRGPLREDGTFGRVDILISELLGSFADNELSPECLDGVQHVLDPIHGISIPASYSAHLTPIAAPKLHTDIVARAHTESTAHETPYVVMLNAMDYLSTRPPQTPSASASASATASAIIKPEMLPQLPEIKQVWSFSHPLPPAILSQADLRRGGSFGGGSGGASGGDGANEHNERFAMLSFPCRERGACHGLAGYFETVLYANEVDSVELSTNPATMEEKSKDMISWFPIFFPLKDPLYFPDRSELQISVWRKTDDRKVWYEWLVEAFTTIKGARVRLGHSELHSSKKNGCLM